MTHTVFGIRHHGPGSARSLERALVELQPDTVLIEGPPEADGLIELAAREDMEPPVALLTYVPDEPARAAFYPFARFSPEWRAMRHALERDVPVRFMDLPAANKMAEGERRRRGLRADPLKALAEVAGHGDPERWWEDVIESRRDGLDAFEAVTEAMGALREAYPDDDPREEQREAYMRQSIRAATKGGAERIAVVCGAWHAPALAEPGPAAPDQRALRGMPKVKVAATWVPWTYGLLARESGYGAGVDSPAWYDQLFDESDDPVARWLARAAALLRDKGLDASAAQVVDAVRLAGALAGIRDRPLAGLDELLDATRAVLCLGSDVPLALVRAELVVGHRLGEVPEDTPMVPLQQDVSRLQRRLRLKAEASVKEVTLDLRREIDRERSRLLHRLNLLDVPWGSRVASSGQGTFKEAFRLEWYPELALELIHAGRWGTTVAAAADARVKARAGEEQSVGALAQLADAVLLADLPDALSAVLVALADRAALDRDTADLMTAVPSLAGILRYGDVRGSDTSAVARVLQGIVLRVAIGLPGAGVGADEETGGQLAEAVDGVNSALALLEDAALTRAWREALRRVADGERLPGTLAGRATRLLHDAGELDPAAPMSRALSPGEDPERGASWIEGFIGESGLVLVHDPELLAVLDGWVASVPPDAFTNVLPLLRRAFSVLPAGERRRLGERYGNLKGQTLYLQTESTASGRGARWRPLRGCSVAEERLRRWRLVLGGDEAEGTGVSLGGEDRGIDGALDAVYGSRGSDLSGSAPTVARWLGELRSHFPSGVVRVVQQDAIDRLGLHRLLLEPEVLDNVTPDVHLAATLMSLRDALPEASRQVARRVVRQVVEDIERRLSARTRAAAKGALDRSSRTRRPKPSEIDWDRTIRANLRHYQPEHRTVIPERLVGHGRRKRSLAAELILCLDQSGSMAASVVHAGVLGASLASLPTLQTRVIAFDTSVVDLTEELGDPVDVLFGIQLGGGTDIDQALGYCQTLVSNPAKTVLILLTDLYEGGDESSMLRRAASLLRAACG